MSPELLELMASSNIAISSVFLIMVLKIDRRFADLNTKLALLLQKVEEHDKRIDKIEEKVDEKQDK